MCAGPGAASLKLFPAFLFLYLLLSGRWRALVAALVTLDVIVVLTGMILGWESYRSYIMEVLPQVQWYRALWENLSLPGVWSRSFESIPLFAAPLAHARPLIDSPSLFWIATITSAVAVVAALAWASAGRKSREGDDLGYASAVVAMLLLSPVAWSHGLLMLILPIVLFWKSARSRPTKTFLAGLTILLSIDPRLSWSFILREGSPPAASALQALLIASLPCYALMALFLVGLALTRQARECPWVPDECAPTPH